VPPLFRNSGDEKLKKKKTRGGKERWLLKDADGPIGVTEC